MADAVTTEIVSDPAPTGTAPELTPQLSTAPPAPKAEKVEAPAADPAPATKGTRDATPPAPIHKSLLEQLKNLPVSEVDALLAAIDEETGASQGEETEDDDVEIDESSVSGPVRYSQMEPGTQKAIAAVHNHMMETAVQAVVDSDQELSYNMKTLGPKAKEAVVATVKDLMERQIEVEGEKFDYNWARVAQQAFSRAKPRIEPFFEKPTPKAGVGPGQGADHYMSRPMAEPKRTPAYADAEDFAAYINQKLQFNMQQAEREQQVPGV